MKSIIALILTAYLAHHAEAANILYLSTVPSPSHHIWNRQLALGLVAKGHNVTILTHDKEKQTPPKNYNEMVIEGTYEFFETIFNMSEFAAMKPIFKISEIMQLYDYSVMQIDYTYKSPTFNTLINYPKNFKFDLVIYDATAGSAMLPFVERFGNPPLIYVTPFLLPTYLSIPMGHHIFPSYMPHYNTPFTDHMSFMDRINNLILHTFDHLYYTYVALPHHQKMAVERFGSVYATPFEKHFGKIALLLANFDPILDYPISFPPNIIPVGGLHARPGGKLPADLQKIMDEASNGVILFSLGTNMKSKFLQESTRKNIIKNLAKLKQTVIWKFEDDIEGLPKNIITRKWLPQNDMMAHPNLKLFISHGGALSTQEAMYHGIPVVGIPCFVDQINNVIKMQHRHLAMMVELSALDHGDSLFERVSQVLDDPTFQDSMSRVSSLVKGSQTSALNRALFWVDHVLKFGYVKEFRMPTSDMYFFQVYYLDLIVICAIALIVLRKLCCKVCRTSNMGQISKKYKKN